MHIHISCSQFPGEELDDWIKAQNWTVKEDGKVFVCNQEAHIKSKNIAEKIDLDSKLNKFSLLAAIHFLVH